VKKRTQLVCTIGPASRSAKKIEALVRAGMDVARLHCSYADQKEMAENIRRVRAASRRLKQPVKILLDLTGAKVRLGEFKRKFVTLKKGAVFTLTSRLVRGNKTLGPISIPELISVIMKGDTVLLADGELKLMATSVTKTDALCRVIVGGRIKAGQAVHVPHKAAPVRVPTAKDLDDVLFGLEHGVDMIAESYATTAPEITALQKFIRQRGAKTPVITKIERREALQHLEQMVKAADGVMVARGDLGISIPLEEIALAQKRIIRCANRAGKPVITATELIFSMMEKNRPTRAEVADITNAVLDGSDAVLLSGETAMGKFPIEAAIITKKIVAVADRAKGKPTH
jgi:pyruvate kinase